MGKGDLMMYLAEVGFNRVAAAELAGVSRATIHRAMRKYRVRAPKSNVKLSARAAGEARARVGCSISELAREYGVSKSTMGRALEYR